MALPPVSLALHGFFGPLARLGVVLSDKVCQRKPGEAEKDAGVARVQPDAGFRISDTLICPSSERKHGAETAKGNREIWIELKHSPVGRDGLVMVPKALTQNTAQHPMRVFVGIIETDRFLDCLQSRLKHFPWIAGNAD